MIYYIVFGLLILCFLLTCYREKAPIDDHKKQKQCWVEAIEKIRTEKMGVL